MGYISGGGAYRFLKRDSGIESLKIFAIFVIIISHVVKTLTSPTSIISNSFVIDVSKASSDPTTVLLLAFRYFGVLGNTLFFLCSAWFLLQQNSYKKQKWFLMLTEIWFVSVIILFITLIIRRGSILPKYIIKSLFPSLFANNWYMTCYLLFYPLHVYLNKIIKQLDRRSLWRVTLTLTTLYIVICFFKNSILFFNNLIVWITIYFLMAYVQRFEMRFANSTKKNIVLFTAGFLGFILLIVVTEIVGLRVPLFKDKMLYWYINNNPFILAMSFAMFNFARNWHFHNYVINYLSSLSLLVYIIHENLLLSRYFRPLIWHFIYVRFGYSYVIGWVFICSLAIFIFAILAAMIYRLLFGEIVHGCSLKLFDFLRLKYLSFEKCVIRFQQER